MSRRGKQAGAEENVVVGHPCDIAAHGTWQERQHSSEFHAQVSLLSINSERVSE